MLSKRLNELKSALNEPADKRERPEAPERPEGIEWQVFNNAGDKISGIANNSSNTSGANHFKNKKAFRADTSVMFYLRGHLNAQKVFLAGNFTDWQNGKIDLMRTDSGWAANVKIMPGKYYYKFIVDDNWMTDEDNLLVENDGYGNENSVYYRPNKIFTLTGHFNAKKVVLSGSFNKWLADDIIMERTATGWQAPIFLSPGTYTYRFVVDGNWMVDSANDNKVPNEFNSFNSFIAIGNTYTFRLGGHTDAKVVALAGNFNDWQQDQLHMHKTATGWELPYALGAGNYEYKFVVDGVWIIDAANPLTVIDNGEQNSYMILAPNHTFHLKGFTDAKVVYLSGDFDNWSSNTLQMTREESGWKYSVYLSTGKHLYKYVVDGKWIKDPGNALWEDDDNSIIWKEK